MKHEMHLKVLSIDDKMYNTIYKPTSTDVWNGVSSVMWTLGIDDQLCDTLWEALDELFI